jgi:fructokinase
METFPDLALLAVTRGALGCRWRTGSGVSGSLPGLNVTVVDTTGAGDGFVAALLTGLLEREAATVAQLAALDAGTLRALFQEANAVGALTTLQKGAIPALPTRNELERFLRDMPTAL